MSKFENLKFMSIGGCCLSVYVLGKDRIRGPIDNALIFNKKTIELIINNQYYSYIKHHKPTKTKKANIVPWEPEFNYEYQDIVRIVHNDVELPKFMPELKRRVNNFNDFWLDFKTNPKKFLIFTIPYSMLKSDKSGLLNNYLEDIIVYFKEIGILDKVIFIGGKQSPRVEKQVWYNNYLTEQDLMYLKTKYNIKYIELNNLIITRLGAAEKEKVFKQFKDKVMEVIK